MRMLSACARHALPLAGGVYACIDQARSAAVLEVSPPGQATTVIPRALEYAVIEYQPGLDWKPLEYSDRFAILHSKKL